MSDGCRKKQRPVAILLALAMALAMALLAPPARAVGAPAAADAPSKATADPSGARANAPASAAAGFAGGGSEGLDGVFDPSCAVGFIGWAPSLEGQAGLYGAIPNAPYLNDGLPMRTQGVFKLYADLLAFSFGRVKLGGAFVFAYTTPSLVYNQTRLKGFCSFGGRVSLSFSLSRAYRLGLGFEYGYCHAGSDVLFASAGAGIVNEFLLGGSPLFDVLLTAPLEGHWRKDIVALTLSVGLCLRFKAPLYEAGASQNASAVPGAGAWL